MERRWCVRGRESVRHAMEAAVAAPAPAAPNATSIGLARKALIKLVMANLGVIKALQTSPMAAALAARVLTAYAVPFVVQCGYVQDVGVRHSVPQMWLETPNAADAEAPLITDVTLLPGAIRELTLLGKSLTLNEDALKPQYTTEKNMYPVHALCVPLATLRTLATDLEGHVAAYIAAFPADRRDGLAGFIDQAVRNAIDESVVKINAEIAYDQDAAAALDK